MSEIVAGAVRALNAKLGGAGIDGSVRFVIEDEGAVKVRSIVQATSLPQPILDLTHHYCQLCAAFHSNGSDG